MGVRCPVCRHDVDPPLEPAFACGRCHVVYHRPCWAYVRRCSIYGCGWTKRRREAALIGPPRDFDRFVLDNPRAVGYGTAAAVGLFYLSLLLLNQ